MRLEEALQRRHLGVEEPARFYGSAAGDAGLARRLTQSGALEGHAGGVATLAWCERGALLLSGGAASSASAIAASGAARGRLGLDMLAHARG